jgi:hypothetical protein
MTDQDGTAQGRDLLGRVGQVLHRQFVLGGGVDPVDPVAVERVERPGAEPGGDAGGDGHAVAELRLAPDPGDQPPVAARHVARGEVQTDQVDAGGFDGGDEGVDIAVGGDGDGERPPELDVLEPGGGRGGRPFEDRDFLKQDRAVQRPAHQISLGTAMLAITHIV